MVAVAAIFAVAIAAVMLVASFILLFAINGLQRWSERRAGDGR